MSNGSTVLSYTLAALAGVFFVKGLSLLSKEGSVEAHGTCEKNNSHA